jgi:L-lactate dehydrogenase complex protein LldF
MKAWKIAFKNRILIDAVNGNIKNLLVKLNKNILGNQKTLPPFAKKSFSKNWKSNLKK